MGFKTTLKAGYVKRIRPVCDAGLLLSSQTRNQEPTIRTVGLPELEMRIKINQPLRRKSATATTEKQQKETAILRWKNGPFFWVPYWKRNSAQCHHRKRTPKRGPFFGPQNGVRLVVQWWRLLLQRFCAWRAPGMKFFAGLHFWYGSWLVAWLFISHTPTYATVCNAGLLLSSQTRNQEPTIRTVGLPELEMRIKINQPLRRKSATATTEKQQKETPILRWKNGPFFWVPYWKRNSAQCHHRKRTPKRGPFFGPQNGVRLVVQWWRLLLQRFCAWRALGMKFFAGLHFWYGSWLVAWLFISHTPTYATVGRTHFSEPATTWF